MKETITAADSAAIVASGYAGLIVGAKSGMAVGALFGPPGVLVGCFAGAFWVGWKWLQATAEASNPVSSAAFNVARAAAGIVIEPPSPDAPAPSQSSEAPCSCVAHSARSASAS